MTNFKFCKKKERARLPPRLYSEMFGKIFVFTSRLYAIQWKRNFQQKQTLNFADIYT